MLALKKTGMILKKERHQSILFLKEINPAKTESWLNLTHTHTHSYSYLAVSAVVWADWWRRCGGTWGRCRGAAPPPGTAAWSRTGVCRPEESWGGCWPGPEPGRTRPLRGYCLWPEREETTQGTVRGRSDFSADRELFWSREGSCKKCGLGFILSISGISTDCLWHILQNSLEHFYNVLSSGRKKRWTLEKQSQKCGFLAFICLSFVIHIYLNSTQTTNNHNLFNIITVFVTESIYVFPFPVIRTL